MMIRSLVCPFQTMVNLSHQANAEKTQTLSSGISMERELYIDYQNMITKLQILLFHMMTDYYFQLGILLMARCLFGTQLTDISSRLLHSHPSSTKVQDASHGVAIQKILNFDQHRTINLLSAVQRK